MSQSTKAKLEKDKLKPTLINEKEFDELRRAFFNKIMNAVYDHWLIEFRKFWRVFTRQAHFRKLPRDYRQKVCDFYKRNTYLEIEDCCHYETYGLLTPLLFREGNRYKIAYNITESIEIPSWKDKEELIKNLDKVAKNYSKTSVNRLVTNAILPLMLQLRLREKLNRYTIDEIFEVGRKEEPFKLNTLSKDTDRKVGSKPTPDKSYKEKLIESIKEAKARIIEEGKKPNRYNVSIKLRVPKSSFYEELRNSNIDFDEI